MSKTPNYDSKVKQILDNLEPGERTCELTGEKWEMTEEEIGWYKKFNVPPSKRSPMTRMKNVCGFFVMYQFWNQVHPETKKKFVSIIHPESGFKSLPDQEWFELDFSDVQRDISFESSILDQVLSLQKEIPFPGTKFIKEPENSISLASLGDVNSYFVMATRSRDSLYSADSLDLENSCEISMSTQVKGSYHVVQSHRVFGCKFILESRDCINSSFLFDCRNCENCFGATNKRNKKYLWFNEQLTKDEWEERISQVNFSCRTKLKEYKDTFSQLVSEAVWPESFGDKCTNVIGNHVNNATDCTYLFNAIDGPFKDLHYCTYCYGNSYDCVYVGAPVSANTCYYTNTPVNSSNIKFSHFTSESQNLEYSIYCYNCEYCFGCVGLRYKKFCIFNQQYEEEEYWQKLDEIKCAMLERGEYGEMLPLSFVPTYLPDAGGPVVYMATEEELKKLGGKIYPPESGGASGVEEDVSGMKTTNDIPDCIDDMNVEEWVNVPIYDPKYKRRFAFIKPELEYYKKQRIAAPDEHFVKRVLDLIMEQGSAVFFETDCAKCSKKITVTKNKNYPERKIYCRECYLKYLETNG